LKQSQTSDHTASQTLSVVPLDKQKPDVWKMICRKAPNNILRVQRNNCKHSHFYITPAINLIELRLEALADTQKTMSKCICLKVINKRLLAHTGTVQVRLLLLLCKAVV